MAGTDDGGLGEPTKDQAGAVRGTGTSGSIVRQGSQETSDTGHIAQSEWTVSDKRGPLNSANADEVEPVSILPGAEAAIDHREQQPDATVLGRDDEGSDFDPSSNASASSASAPDSDPRAAGSTPSGAASDRPRRASPVPLAIAVIAGAVIGAGSALIYTQYALSDQTARLDRVATQIAELDQRLPSQAADLPGAVADLQKRVSLLQRQVGGKAAASGAPAEALHLSQQNATTEGAALTSKVAALQASVDALQKATGSDGDLRQSVGALQSSLKVSRANIDMLQSEQKQLAGKIANTADGARKEATATQSSLASLRDEQKALASQITAPAAAVVADSLLTAINAGQPFAKQVDALGSLGVSGATLDTLRAQATTGVLPVAQLAARFDKLANQIDAVDDNAAPHTGFLSRLKRGLFNLVSVRRTEPSGSPATGTKKGIDTASRVAAIKADLARGDVGAAYNDWSALPTEAKAASADWGRDAKKSADVMSAARTLQTESIGTIAAKRS